jgi:alpha-ribazole phosphatase
MTDGRFRRFDEVRGASLKRLVLIRHGETASTPGRYLGRTDLPLSVQGLRSAERLARRLRTISFSHCLSSPSMRAMETARMLVDGTGLTIEPDADLMEIDFGRWEGLTFQEIAARDPLLVERWARGQMDFRFPEGEALADFWGRVGRARQRLVEKPGENGMVVAHAGVIRFLLCHFLGLDPRSHLMFEIRHASVTTIRLVDGQAVLAGLSDVYHLEET